jgi:hypothetical protein
MSMMRGGKGEYGWSCEVYGMIGMEGSVSMVGVVSMVGIVRVEEKVTCDFAHLAACICSSTIQLAFGYLLD